MNQPGDPIIGGDRSWWELERDKLRFDPVVLRPEQMVHVESVMPDISARGGWECHVGAGGPDHVRALLTADVEGDAVRKWFKRWLGESMSARWPRPEGATWWPEGGSVKWVWERDYFENIFDYLNRQRASGRI